MFHHKICRQSFQQKTIKNTSTTTHLPAASCHSHAWAETVQQSAPVQGDQCALIHLSIVEHWSMMDVVEVHTAHTHTHVHVHVLVTWYSAVTHCAVFLMLIQKLLFLTRQCSNIVSESEKAPAWTESFNQWWTQVCNRTVLEIAARNIQFGQHGKAQRQTDRQTPVQQPLFQDNLGKLTPERLNQSGF